MLIAARALQGFGAALVSPAALSIITTTFHEGPDRTKALGFWSAIAAGGAAFGLLLGGVLTELLSWEWIFFVNVPVGIAACLLSLRATSATYSRYADDLTFSGPARPRRHRDADPRRGSIVPVDAGFAIAPAKTRVLRLGAHASGLRRGRQSSC